MRKFLKMQLLSSLKLLGQAHLEIKNQIERRMTGSAQSLLEQCQQCAVELGSLMEREEGKEIPTIHLLEDYCELLYQIYVAAESPEQYKRADRIYKSLRKLLIKIENSVRSDIGVRYEIVFLPYKASMWDCMDSIWRAAEEDSDCDAYVIPIPYYDKNPDGSFRECHYEGNQYPAYVPVVDYNNYDFEARHPDIILIHNPYDECNYVTSVHPFFYSANLRKFTDKLVYIPYFVLDEPVPGDLDTEEFIAKFCLCPGVWNAHQVIVQSEAMRQVYINILVKMAATGMKRKEWEKRILGLGSPKFDQRWNTGNEMPDIPKEWLKIIRKPDGSSKKIIFYNTSINGFLNHDEKMLVKMKAVFHVLKEYQDEVALLWRPHPLIWATLESMRPQLCVEYKKIVESYKEEAWGIYDDSADMHRAVMLCDAYYGDGSSVVPLCKEAEKSILLQNMEITDYDRENDCLPNTLLFENVCDDGECLWFTEYEYNALFRMEKKKWKAELMGVFPGEDFYRGRLYTSMAVCNGKIYFAPFAAREIAEYDLETKNFRKIPVKQPEKEAYRTWENEKFFRVVSLGMRVYFIPYHYPGILRYDTETEEMDCIDSWVEEIRKKSSGPWGYFVEYEVLDHKLILPCTCADAVIVFDTDTDETQIVQTADTDYECKYCGICREGGDFYFLSADGTITRTDVHLREIERYKLPVSGAEDIEYYPMRSTKGRIMLFPFNKNAILRIDTTGMKKIVWERVGEEWTEDCYFAFPGGIAGNEVIYASSKREDKLIAYDPASGGEVERELFLSREDRLTLEMYRGLDFLKRMNPVPLIENENESLKLMIEGLRIKGEDRKTDFSMGAGNGEKIYHTLISE